MANLNDYHNASSGRCFMVGNGPSLLEQLHLLPLLKDETTFCCNSIGEWDELPFEPTYYGVTDLSDYKWLERNRFPHWKKTLRFNVQFVDWPEHPDFQTVQKAPDNVQVDPYGTVGMDETLPPIPTARTTPLTLGQLALWMGHRELFYIGIEQTRGYAYDVDATMSMTGRHAFPLDKNPKYQTAIQRNAAQMRKDIEAHGGRIVDCTPGGLLNVTGKDIPRRNVPWRDVLPYESLESVLGVKV